jgi:16S rRNA (guanine527-N7)-methyltransferase
VTNATELKGLAAGIDCELSLEAAEQLLVYLDAMLDENQRINLTGVREREPAVLFHVLDSLAVGSAALEVETTSCLDLGTGNGFPGVAVACLFPEAEVVLMDRTLKKLKAIERALAVAGFDPERVRTVQMDAAEAPSHGHGRYFDLVCARAIGEPRPVGLLARPLLRPFGSFLCWMSEDQRASNPNPKAYQQPVYFEYDLPAPANRRRVLARFSR